MGKAGRWLKSFLQPGKKGRPPPPPPLPESMPVAAVPVGAIPKEKRWSFRRPVPAEKAAEVEAEPVLGLPTAESGFDQKKHAVAVAVATAAAADAAVAAAQAAAVAAIRLSTSRKADLPASVVEAAAAVRIQATFRGYLARTALCALRGIVRLQALVRGQLVRKQATATLRCMQALLMAQSQLRAQRIRLLQEQEQEQEQQQPPPRPRQSPHLLRHRRSYEMDRSCEENAKIVEVDSSVPAWRGAAKGDHGRCSPAPSAMTEMMSPRTYSGHFEDLPFATAHSSPQHASEPFPSYMANTESSRAKARSQSAPRQRTDVLERQPSRKKGAAAAAAAAAAVPRSARMQRSSSSSAQAGAAPRWSAAKLDASLDDSECGSTSSVLTATTVYSRTRSLVGFEVRRGVY